MSNIYSCKLIIYYTSFSSNHNQNLTKNSYVISYIRQGSVATTPQPLRIHEQ